MTELEKLKEPLKAADADAAYKAYYTERATTRINHIKALEARITKLEKADD